MFKTAFIFFTVLFMSSVPCHEASASEFLDRPALLNDLNSERWVALEQKLNALQKGFEAGDTSDIYIEHALETFSHSSPKTLVALNDWVKSEPESAFAYAARGVHYWRIHWHGSNNYNLNLDDSENAFPSPKGFIYKGDELEKARADFEKSISLNSRLAPPYAYIINISMAERAIFSKGIAYRNALNNVPDSEAVRWRYFHSLIPQWGGSKSNVMLEIKLADFFAKRKGHAGAPVNFLSYFEAMQKEYKGNHVSALELFAQSTTEESRWYIGYSYVETLRKNKDYENAIETSKALLIRYPQNPLLLDSIARAHCRLERYEEAFEFWKQSAELDPHDPDMLDYSAWCHIEWGRKIDEGNIVTDITTADQQYELALSDIQAAMIYAGNTRKIRFRRASVLNYQLKRYEDAVLDTKYLIALKPKNTSYINLHSQVIFNLHDCEFKKLDSQLLDLCQKGSCSNFHRDSANWRLSAIAGRGLCK